MSYANVAANGSSPKSDVSKTTDVSLNSPAPSAPAQSSAAEQKEQSSEDSTNVEMDPKSSTTADSSVSSSHDEKPSTAQHPSSSPKKEKKSLAPAPVPSKSAWGSSSAHPSSKVDEHKWPTPDKAPLLQQLSQNTNKAAHKFIKPNKWVPINAKVVLPSPRGHGTNPGQHRNKRKNKNTRKKTGPPSMSGEDHPAKKDDASTKKESSDHATDAEYTNTSATPQASSEQLQNEHPGHSEGAEQHTGAAQDDGPQHGEGFNRGKFSGHGSAPAQKTFKKFQQNGGQQGFRPHNLIQQPRQQNGSGSPYAQNPNYYNYNGGRQYRPSNGNGGQYRRNNSSGNINAYANGYRAPMGIPFVPHIPHHPLPQGMIPGMPYGAPIPVQIPPPISPKQDPLHALTQQIDYYFSLENLIRDVFLRKNMGTEGWIDLDLILNFKRVKIIANSIHNAIEEADEEKKAKELDNNILKAVQRCENVEIGYLNGKDHNTATATEVQLRVKQNFEQWLLPDNLKL